MALLRLCVQGVTCQAFSVQAFAFKPCCRVAHSYAKEPGNTDIDADMETEMKETARPRSKTKKQEAVEGKDEDAEEEEERLGTDDEEEGGSGHGHGDGDGDGEEDMADMREAAEAIMAAGRMVPRKRPPDGLPPVADAMHDGEDEDEDEDRDANVDGEGYGDWVEGDGGEGGRRWRGMEPLSEAAVLADSLRKARLEVGGIYSFNAKEAALCKLHGWDHIRECAIKRVTSSNVVVTCKTTFSSPTDGFYGSYRIPAPTALRVLGSHRQESGGAGGSEGGGAGGSGGNSLLFPSGGSARKRAAAAAATHAGRGLPEALALPAGPHPLGAEPSRVGGPIVPVCVAVSCHWSN